MTDPIQPSTEKIGAATATTQPEYSPAPPAAHPLATLPANNVGWAVAAVVLFWPLAFSAFSHSMRVYPLWAAGDMAGAQYASERTKKLGVLSLWIAAGIFALFILVYAVIIIAVIATGADTPPPHHRGY